MASSCLGCALFPHPPIMLPEIGKGELANMQATVDAVTKASALLSEQNPDTIVIMTPPNLVFQDGAALLYEPVLYGNLANFGFPDLSMQVRTDMELAGEILRQSKNLVSLHGITKDWSEKYGYPLTIDQGAFVPLYYLRKAGFNGPIVLLSPCFTQYGAMETLGEIVQKSAAALHRRIAVIASGDLSHRLLPGSANGYTPQGAVFDKTVMQALKEQSTAPLQTMTASLIDEAGMCGLPSVYFLFGVLRAMQPALSVYSYEGPFGVGYGVALYMEDATSASPTPAKPDIRVQLARQSIAHYLSHHKVLSVPRTMPEELLDSAGAFVSLKKHGAPRGCIGTFLPMYLNLAEEIIHNAVAAATRDPRFPPVGLDELEDLDISVDVLSRPEGIASADQLDPKKYGVIVMSHARTGLLLPDLEGVDTVEQQIAIAKEKAGIPPQVKPDLYRFTVTRYR